MDKDRVPVILVVDDEPKVVAILAKALTLKGYGVLEAFSGEEALKIASEKAVDLVILDIVLPDMNGIWVTRRLRQDEKTRTVPIIIITGHGEKENRINGIEAGADDFLTKPFDIDEILARVRTALNLSYYRSQLHDRDELKTLMKETVDGVIICSPDWTIEEMNDSARDYLNISGQKSLNLLDHLFQGFSVSIPREEVANLSHTHKTFYIANKGSSDRKPVYLLANLDIFKVPSGEPSSILLDLRNVTAEHV